EISLWRCLSFGRSTTRGDSLFRQTHFHHVLNKTSKRFCIERLVQNPQIRGHCLRRIAVTSRKDHWQTRITRTDFSREPDAVDGPWHDDISKDEIDLRTIRQQS